MKTNKKRDLQIFYKVLSPIINDMKFNEDELLILNKYWNTNESFKDIAKALNITASRVDQIYNISFAKIINKLINVINTGIHITIDKEKLIQLEKENIAMKYLIKLYGIEDKFLIKVDDIKVSTRALNVIKATDIEYLHELTMFTRNDLMHFRNAGIKTINEITNYMALFGLNLKGETRNAAPLSANKIECMFKVSVIGADINIEKSPVVNKIIL